MTWLVTGGAGYIGGHVNLAFQDAGIDIVVLDDLSTGYRAYVPDGVPFYDARVGDADALRSVMSEHEVTGVMHLAAWKYAGVSVDRPLHFYDQNVTAMQTLLGVVGELGVDRFVLSSSSSWYGTPDVEVVREDAPPCPESPYGETKVISEWLLRDLARIQPSLGHASLRYFNVVGSGPPHLADHSPHNLFPKVLRALQAGERPVVFGTDYPTRDGSCIRDYVHVVDLANAHVTAAQHLDAGRPCAPAYNVGRGEGSTVLEVLETIRRVTGIDTEHEVLPRRAGDPARVIGAVDLIERDLGWKAAHDLDDMVSSAWAAWQYHLETYGGSGAPPVGARGLGGP